MISMSTTSKEDLEAAQFPIVFIPFNGTPIAVKIRELTQAQILACGNFSLIETLEDKIRKKSKHIKIRDVIAYASRNHEIVKASLVSPTYDEIFEVVGVDPKIKEAKKKLLELKELLKQTKNDGKRKAIEEEIDSLRIWCEYILPDDFIAHVVSYALCIDKSDIKTVSERMLLDAAILAERGHDNPADHIDGRFTPFMRDDINKRAWSLLAKKRKKN